MKYDPKLIPLFIGYEFYYDTGSISDCGWGILREVSDIFGDGDKALFLFTYRTTPGVLGGVYIKDIKQFPMYDALVSSKLGKLVL